MRKLLKDKRGAMYLEACIVVMLLCMIFSVVFYYTATVMQVKVQRKQAIQVLDAYTQLNAIDIYDSIKNQTDDTESLAPDRFIATLCETQSLSSANDQYIAYTPDGDQKYIVKDVSMSFVIDNTTKIKVDYTLSVPLYILGNTFWVDVPMTISTSLNAKFDVDDANTDSASYIVNHYLMDTSGNYSTSPTVSEMREGIADATLTIANLAKAYTGFTYSYGQVDGATVLTTTVLEDGSRIISLYYSRNQYIVALTAGEGISQVSGADIYYYGQSVTIDAVVADGYTWSGWVGTHETTTQQYTFTMPASNVSDKAVARVNTYTVVYDGNGATDGATESSVHTYGVEQQLTANGFVREGYSFAGWNTQADGSGVAYEDQQVVINLTDVADGEVVLYAQWVSAAPVKYQVRHYLMTTSGSYSSSAFMTETLYETAGTVVSVEDFARVKTGFTYSYGTVGDDVVTEAEILADGSQVINLYYERNQYYLAVNWDATKAVTGSSSGYVYYGQTVTIYVNARATYAFVAWTGDIYATSYSYEFTMPAYDVTANAVFVNRITGPTTNYIRVGLDPGGVGYGGTTEFFINVDEWQMGVYCLYSDSDCTQILAEDELIITLPTAYREYSAYSFVCYRDSSGGTADFAKISETQCVVMESEIDYMIYQYYADGTTNFELTADWALTGEADLDEILYGELTLTASNREAICGYDPDAESQDIVIPEFYCSNGKWYMITGIDSYALGVDNITSVTIPDSVTFIDDGAFYYSSGLTSVTFGENSRLESIGDRAFYSCSSLTSIVIPDSVVSIGDDAFCYCTSLASITIGENSQLESIGDSAFYGVVAQSIVIPYKVTSIGKRAFVSNSKWSSIIFLNPDGWYVTTTNGATSGTDVDVTDPATAALYLRSTYIDYYWYRAD